MTSIEESIRYIVKVAYPQRRLDLDAVNTCYYVHGRQNELMQSSGLTVDGVAFDFLFCVHNVAHFWGERELSVSSLPTRTPEDLSRFVVELQQRELALKEKNNSITSRWVAWGHLTV